MRAWFRFLTAIAVSIFFSNVGWATEKCDSTQLDRASLEKLIAEHHITKVSEILSHLDPCFKRSSVKIYQSSSLQCATPNAPRVVIFLNGRRDNGKGRATTRCAFNSGNRADYEALYRKNPSLDCHENTLECEHFIGGDEAKHEFYEVTVPRDEKGKYYSDHVHEPRVARISGVNPPQCMTACHRGLSFDGKALDPRPVIENYELWPGFYGSFHDELFKGTESALAKEKENFAHGYYPQKQSNARYGQLVEILGPDLEPINDDVREEEGSKPVTDLQNTLEFENYQRIARKFTNPTTRKRIWPFRYALLGALACNADSEVVRQYPPSAPLPTLYPIESFLPDEVRKLAGLSYQDIASANLVEHQNNLQHLVELQRQVGPLDDGFGHKYETDMANDPKAPWTTYHLRFANEFTDIARLTYLARILGINDDDWSLSFRYTHDFAAGAQNTRQILASLVKKLVDKDTEKDLAAMDLDKIEHFGQAGDEICNKLKQKSLEALSGALKGKTLPLVAQAKKDNEKNKTAARVANCELPAPPAAIAECISCHVHGNERYFPFESAAILSARLRSPLNHGQSTTLLDVIQRLVASGKMPYNRKTTEKERREIASYFTSLSEKSCVEREPTKRENPASSH